VNGRRLLAASVLPLAAAMTFLAATPWLRAFPPETVAPLFIAAAIVSVAIPRSSWPQRADRWCGPP